MGETNRRETTHTRIKKEKLKMIFLVDIRMYNTIVQCAYAMLVVRFSRLYHYEYFDSSVCFCRVFV